MAASESDSISMLGSSHSTQSIGISSLETEVCQCGLCSPLCRVNTTGSPCLSEIPSPTTMWAPTSNGDAPGMEICQPTSNGPYLEASECLDNIDVSGMMLPCLNDPNDPTTYTFPSSFNYFGQTSSTSNSPENTCLAYGPIGTIATKNERRKAQNRAAQRAFRVRQQQALSEATVKLRALQEELKEAVVMRDHFERLFKTLSAEHERLLGKFKEVLMSAQTQTQIQEA